MLRFSHNFYSQYVIYYYQIGIENMGDNMEKSPNKISSREFSFDDFQKAAKDPTCGNKLLQLFFNKDVERENIDDHLCDNSPNYSYDGTLPLLKAGASGIHRNDRMPEAGATVEQRSREASVQRISDDLMRIAI